MAEIEVISNRFSAWAQFKGHKITGVIEHTSEYTSAGDEPRVLLRTVILNSGYGLTFSSNGSFWITGKDEVARILSNLEYERTGAALSNVRES